MKRLFALLLALAAIPACAREERAEAPAPEVAETAPATDTPAEPTEAAPTTPPRVGTVRGIVRLAEGAELPIYTEAELGRTRATAVQACPAPTDADTQPVALGEGRALEGVMLSATGDPQAFFAQVPPHTPVERRLDIEGCRLTPRLMVALKGDSLVIQNKSQAVMFPIVGAATYADSLAFGAARTVELDRAGIQVVQCGTVPFCGRTDLVVVMNPVYTVSGEAGRFELTNVPADQPVTIHAWHPLFREARVETRVSEGGEATVEIILEPRPTQAEPAGAAQAPAGAAAGQQGARRAGTKAGAPARR